MMEMFGTLPKNYICTTCKREQYTNKVCYGCGGKTFKDIKHDEISILSLSEEELSIIQKWAYIASLEMPFTEEESKLYYKITNS